MRTRPQGRRGGGNTRPQRQPRRKSAAGQNRDLLYGRNAVRESLRAGRRKHIRLVLAEGVQTDSRLVEIERLAHARGVRIEHAPRDRIDSQVGPGHQGVMLECSSYPYAVGSDLQNLVARRSIVLALDGIEDPRNVGTLLRTAEAVGVELVVVPSDRAVGVTPAVVNASSGAVEFLAVQRETNLARWLRQARMAGLWVVGLAGTENAVELFETDVPAPLVLVVGSEGRGIRRLIQEQCDLLVSLPMFGQIESLNAAVAGSIALYEVKRDSVETPQ